MTSAHPRGRQPGGSTPATPYDNGDEDDGEGVEEAVVYCVVGS
jgi:hypothetical protein